MHQEGSTWEVCFVKYDKIESRINGCWNINTLTGTKELYWNSWSYGENKWGSNCKMNIMKEWMSEEKKVV